MATQKKQSRRARHIKHITLCKISGSISQERRGHWTLKEFGGLCLNQPAIIPSDMQAVASRLHGVLCDWSCLGVSRCVVLMQAFAGNTDLSQAPVFPGDWLPFTRSRARTHDRHRRPNDVIEEHRKRATLVWVGLLVTVVGCEERADSMAVARNSGSEIF